MASVHPLVARQRQSMNRTRLSRASTPSDTASVAGSDVSSSSYRDSSRRHVHSSSSSSSFAPSNSYQQQQANDAFLSQYLDSSSAAFLNSEQGLNPQSSYYTEVYDNQGLMMNENVINNAYYYASSNSSAGPSAQHCYFGEGASSSCSAGSTSARSLQSAAMASLMSSSSNKHHSSSSSSSYTSSSSSNQSHDLPQLQFSDMLEDDPFLLHTPSLSSAASSSTGFSPLSSPRSSVGPPHHNSHHYGSENQQHLDAIIAEATDSYFPPFDYANAATPKASDPFSHRMFDGSDQPQWTQRW